MHEYSIVSALVDKVEAQARAHPGAIVRVVHVAIGELAGVEIELLVTAFDTFKPKTVCAAAAIAVESRPARWRCPKCKTVIARGEKLRCEPCASPARLESGDEIMLQRIELEMEDDDV
ncbi:MAG: hydrogenase maturation nickel metallochaperone HypA [Deltaproteobacteria bacterium]|nr:hydrogenase maturation nickel metallochaperone HypA [Deltaproteobacteria bacterium]